MRHWEGWKAGYDTVLAPLGSRALWPLDKGDSIIWKEKKEKGPGGIWMALSGGDKRS